MFGGAALMLLGAGLILSHPQVRRYLGDVDLNGLVEGALPDFERYMKLRSDVGRRALRDQPDAEPGAC